MDPAVNRSDDEPGILEHLQMFRDRGLGGTITASELTSAPEFARGEPLNHRAARPIRQCAKGAVEPGD